MKWLVLGVAYEGHIVKMYVVDDEDQAKQVAIDWLEDPDIASVVHTPVKETT